MGGLDLAQLLDLKIPGALCPKCFAIFLKTGRRTESILTAPLRGDGILCPVCEVLYSPSESYLRLSDFLEYHDLTLFQCEDALMHGLDLAHKLGRGGPDTLHFGKFLQLVSSTKKFVHFILDCDDPEFIGALKLLSVDIPVRGIVVNEKNNEIRVIEDHFEGLPFFCMKQIFVEDPLMLPLTNFVVIDGLVALIGRQGLTSAPWEENATQYVTPRAITDAEEVADLNNTHFARTWAKYSPKGDEIDTDAPF